MKYTKKIHGTQGVLSCLGLCLLMSCSSGGARRANPNTTGETTELAQPPSPIDPAKPPRVDFDGVSEGALVERDSLDIKLKISDYPLADGWQAAVVVLNDLPGRSVYEADGEVTLKEGLREGANTVRVFLVRSWGESLKNPEAFKVVNFYHKKKDGAVLAAPGAPLLTLAEPRGLLYSAEAGKKILLDFLVKNADISENKFRVHYRLNGEKRELVHARPYHFQNLEPGTYNLEIELVDRAGRPVKGLLTKARTVFSVQP